MNNKNNISNGADKKIQQILEDLYKIDASLRSNEPGLIMVIEEMLKAKPDTRFDENFSRELRAEIIKRAVLAQGTKKEKRFFAGLFRAPKFAYAFGGIALALFLVLPIAYKYYSGGELPIVPGIISNGKIDDWQYNISKKETNKAFGSPNAVQQTTGGWGINSAVPNSKISETSDSLGFAAGGAKDINNFRKNIENNYLPLPTDITYEGLFYDYYFDTAKQEQCDELFCPSYSYAVSADPFSGKDEYYLSAGLNSGIKEADFQRKKLNLVVVLDISGSMGSPFDRYYYDQFGGRKEAANPESGEDYQKKKIEIAAQSVVGFLGHLKDSDRFGMVLYEDQAFLAKSLGLVGNMDMQKIKEHILAVREQGGTQMSAGMKMGTDLFGELKDADQNEYENRIIFLTDAMPNIGETSENGLLGMLKKNAANKIYTTFIGIGVDFNTELVEYITKIRGANYYSVHSSADFKKRMDGEFEFMVTPLVFNLNLMLDAKGYRIEKVYGSPEANEATGEIMKVNTLFPSSTENGETKGGIVLLKLKKISDDAALALKVSYEDRTGKSSVSEAKISFAGNNETFRNNGIRKGVLLARYADLMKNWINDERKNYGQPELFQPSIDKENGIIIPPAVQLGQWERQSLPLKVSGAYNELFGEFKNYFEKEANIIGDSTLKQEIVILDELSKQ